MPIEVVGIVFDGFSSAIGGTTDVADDNKSKDFNEIEAYVDDGSTVGTLAATLSSTMGSVPWSRVRTFR